MIYHLSHIDLDGFFCQYLSTKKFEKVTYYNSNYGKEIYSHLKKIFKQATTKDTVFITDLNLDKKECEYIQSFVDLGISVSLYDHHISGLNMSKKYDWYYLDDSRSASKIFAEQEKVESNLLDSVNSYDMWEDDSNLDIGCFLSEFINKELLFYFNESKVIFYNEYFKYMEDNISEISNPSIFILNYLKDKDYFNPNYSIKRNLSFKYVNDMFKSPIKGEYIFLYNIDREYFQYISQFLLLENNRLVIVLISKNGRLSFRSKSSNVNQLSNDYFNGSGHENASGGTLGVNHIANKEEGLSIFLSKLT